MWRLPGERGQGGTTEHREEETCQFLASLNTDGVLKNRWALTMVLKKGCPVDRPRKSWGRGRMGSGGWHSEQMSQHKGRGECDVFGKSPDVGQSTQGRGHSGFGLDTRTLEGLLVSSVERTAVGVMCWASVTP